MPKNKIKFIKSAIVTIFSLVLIISTSGCRKKEPAETDTLGVAGKTIEIVWWHLFDTCDTFKGQIQSFESANKGVKIVCKKFTDPAGFDKLLTNEIAEGEGPDIFAIKNTDVLRHKKKIYPVPASIMVPQLFRDTFFAVAADDLVLLDEEGMEQIYALPISIDTLALYYNKTLFRDNLSYTDKPGTTWEEIKEQVYALTKKDNSIERFGVAGLAAGRSDNIQRAVDILQMLFIQFDTKMVDEGEKRAIFANQQGTYEGTGKPYYPGVEAIKMFTSFGDPSYKNYSWNQLITGQTGDSKEVGVFVKGKVAMIFGYSWLFDEIRLQIQAAQKKGDKHISEEEIGIAPIPQLLEETETGNRDAFASYYALTVSRNSEYPDIAWQFLDYLSGAESLQDYHEKTHKPTPRKDMVEEQMTEKTFGVFARQAFYAKSIKTFEDENFNNIFKEAIDSVAKTKKTAEDALKLAQTRMICVLEKQKDPTMDKNCEEIE